MPTHSTDPNLKPATNGDLKRHMREEESLLKKVLNTRVAILAVLSLVVPGIVALKGTAWAQKQMDDTVVKHTAPMQAKDASIEVRVQKLEDAVQNMALDVRELKTEQRGVRDDLRMLFPRLPPLQPLDGGH